MPHCLGTLLSFLSHSLRIFGPSIGFRHSDLLFTNSHDDNAPFVA
jgi:hypothetical protein